mmetsp:Transcript_105056/g.324068  ORF Transcript_105056/g.324068 Transcript_105056/m.324068 type:complete len:246 (-) Transcript_105056:355-1092(-)
MATPGMSRPREATSVATRTPRSLPLLLAVSLRNFWRVSSRSHCSLLLWMERTQMPRPARCKSCTTSSQRAFMLEKTMAVSPAPSSVLISACRCAGLSSGSITITVCFTLALAVSLSPVSPWPMRTWTAALDVRLAAVLWTSFGHVAVKKSVCRRRPPPRAPPPSSGLPDFGHLPTIWRMSSSKPMSSIRSASSKTRYVTASRLTDGAWPLSSLPLQKSSKRPGVAMRTSQPFRNSPTCSPLPTPP